MTLDEWLMIPTRGYRRRFERGAWHVTLTWEKGGVVTSAARQLEDAERFALELAAKRTERHDTIPSLPPVDDEALRAVHDSLDQLTTLGRRAAS